MTSHKGELKEMRKAIGATIHRHRSAKKMTLRKLSIVTGIAIEKLDQYEIGKNRIQLEEVFLIARPLGIPIEKLLLKE